MMNNWW